MAQIYMNRQQKIDKDVFERLDDYREEADTIWQPDDYEAYHNWMSLQNISAYNEAKDIVWHSKNSVRTLTQTSPIDVGAMVKARGIVHSNLMRLNAKDIYIVMAVGEHKTLSVIMVEVAVLPSMQSAGWFYLDNFIVV